MELWVACSTVHEILIKKLGMSEVNTCWVPRLPTDKERKHLARCSDVFLSRYDEEGDEFLDIIITI